MIPVGKGGAPEAEGAIASVKGLTADGEGIRIGVKGVTPNPEGGARERFDSSLKGKEELAASKAKLLCWKGELPRLKEQLPKVKEPRWMDHERLLPEKEQRRMFFEN